MRTETIDSNEILQEAIRRGIVDIEQLADDVNDMKRKEVLSQHPSEIWQNKEGMFLTYVYDKDGKRMIRRRKTREELEDYLVDYYKKLEEEVYLSDLFEKWSSEKLEYGEIQKQSYDRYVSDFHRFFQASLPICRKKVKNITEDDLEAFIKTTIRDEKLSRKSYSGLATLINGMFKYAKRHKYTTISITQFMGDLELSKKGFTAVNHPKERETFSEEELPKIKNYLFANIDIWNLGLILQFQTGMRIGEIAALKPGDIGTHCINVRRTEVKYKDEDGKWCVKVQEHTKTDAGYRCVILPPQAEETLAMIQKLNPNGEYLFMNNGKRIRENTFNKRLTGICDKLGIEHHSTHKIRKTYGTTLLDGNVTDGVIADQMGHKDISTTRQFYYYSNKSEKTKRDQITKAISF